MSQRLVLLFDVLSQDTDWRAADRAGEVGRGPQPVRPPVVPCQAGELLPHTPRGHALEAVDQPRERDLGREADQQMHMVGRAVERGQPGLKVGAYVPHDLLHPPQVRGGEHGVPVPGHEDQVCVQHENTVPAGAYSVVAGHETKYTERVRLRYQYRLDPAPGQRQALARAFGCARVVFHDGPRARREAHAAGLPRITGAELPARLTTARASPERTWLGEVPAVVLQQALADLGAAYRNFFTSLTGKRNGPGSGPPRFRSGKDHRQAIRFTASARFKVPGNGRLRLPKIGDVAVRWSRDLPSAPSSVTVIVDAAGRYFASFVVGTGPVAGAGRFPVADAEAGIDLGLTAFAVLPDGTRLGAECEQRVVGAQTDVLATSLGPDAEAFLHVGGPPRKIPPCPGAGS